MSTVLWANVLVDGVVQSDEQDRDALYRHVDRLDRLAKSLGLPSFSAVCDSTDMRFNAEDIDLPAGMASTNEVMAASGEWLPRDAGRRLVDGLLAHIEANDIRFGLLRNRRMDVLRELAEVRAFIDAHPAATKFNFAVVG